MKQFHYFNFFNGEMRNAKPQRSKLTSVKEVILYLYGRYFFKMINILVNLGYLQEKEYDKSNKT